MLNYRHLLSFWTVVREGGVTRAAEVLGVSQPTVSAQVAALERRFQQPLFVRTGRGVALTETGRLAHEYADEIFRLGGELQNALREGCGQVPRVVVGTTDVLPKVIVYRLLQPLFEAADGPRLVCVEDKPERLLADLATHGLDLVLTDSTHYPSVKVRVFHHLLGESGVTFLAAPAVAARLSGPFPRCLNGAPVLLPTDNTSVRRALDQWFAEEGLSPRLRGEFADTALMKVFGQAGHGVFPLPSAVERDVQELYGVVPVGRAERVRTRFYAVSVQRRLRHPAVVAICETARQELFG